MWDHALQVCGLPFHWSGNYSDDALALWTNNVVFTEYVAFPVTLTWGLWLARNLVTYGDTHIPPTIFVDRGLDILGYFPKLISLLE